MGATRVFEAADGWTAKTCDGSVVANSAHTIVVGAAGPILMTAYESPGDPGTVGAIPLLSDKREEEI